MRRLEVLEHGEQEGPGRIASVARSLGLEVRRHRLHLGQPVPKELDPDTLLVVMGGPMGVGDLGDRRWPFLDEELALIRQILQRGQPVLGVCLGAQLLAHAAGSRVYPLLLGEPPVPRSEVGWKQVKLVRTARQEPVLSGLDSTVIMWHWHADTFDLPAGAVLLASTDECPHQMFRLGTRAFGVQFHPELTRQMIAEWVSAGVEQVEQAGGPGAAARIAAETERCFAQYEAEGDQMICNLLLGLLL